MNSDTKMLRFAPLFGAGYAYGDVRTRESLTSWKILIMATRIFPSSYRCDCGHESDFFENTVREMAKMSKKKRVRLGDAADAEHTIVFYKGEAVEILCPKLGKCTITSSE